ncbi:hypothetical protein [Tanticharoenia sakaeratensis]|uniref:Uncharacterized protein n=1 Tax=Tanticharoenia sakaeratensis NBRC 103193 TaxID=1231623 RepID=A0A0D6MI22_9PROT|nr:hypothetical protein [Tanticharoenia sakaeratensis]GAN53161.1 hypothetical protein Tasa_007_006 [Tanticharoenia sakaeratensis NBRC 103193]GBQ23896.1 hypothetical protein AA103193_2565 [Tanticharoenia sakaeratensis NBRC 103193]
MIATDIQSPKSDNAVSNDAALKQACLEFIAVIRARDAIEDTQSRQWKVLHRHADELLRDIVRLEATTDAGRAAQMEALRAIQRPGSDFETLIETAEDWFGQLSAAVLRDLGPDRRAKPRLCSLASGVEAGHPDAALIDACAAYFTAWRASEDHPGRTVVNTTPEIDQALNAALDAIAACAARVAAMPARTSAGLQAKARVTMRELDQSEWPIANDEPPSALSPDVEGREHLVWSVCVDVLASQPDGAEVTGVGRLRQGDRVLSVAAGDAMHDATQSISHVACLLHWAGLGQQERVPDVLHTSGASDFAGAVIWAADEIRRRCAAIDEAMP